MGDRSGDSVFSRYRKIPKISPGAYIFQRPFLISSLEIQRLQLAGSSSTVFAVNLTLFEGLIFGGAYIRRGLCTEGNLRFKIDWASL